MDEAPATTRQKPTQLYPYQERDLNSIFDTINQQSPGFKLVYQLPTGGGKTVVFSEIAKRFIEKYNQKVAVLTHRTELCRQTSTTLKNLGVRNKIINSAIRKVPPTNEYLCYVAMVETLKNRIKEKKVATDNVGLVIIDEAHHNSFRKLLGSFKNAIVIGVTATPLSSDSTLPMNEHYHSLITGEDIPSLINQGFLAKPKTIAHEVELNSLKTGIHGDYTVSSSNELYSSPAMLKLLLDQYESHSKNKKTLIFNNGIETSIKVCDLFNEAGYPTKHLDNKTPAEERKSILQWFKKTKGAILTSVSILTTGFDEPTVQTVILNRATTSLTLYHQMVGRGARKLPSKKTFTIIDLGNNRERFGDWHAPVDWNHVFENPKEFADQTSANSGTAVQSHALSAEVRAKFSHTLELTFDIESAYYNAIATDQKPKTVIRESLRQQALMCIDNAETQSEALHLAEALEPEIEWRVKQYVKCLENPTPSYKEYLLQDYTQRLRIFVRKLMHLKLANSLSVKKN